MSKKRVFLCCHGDCDSFGKVKTGKMCLTSFLLFFFKQSCLHMVPCLFLVNVLPAFVLSGAVSRLVPRP